MTNNTTGRSDTVIAFARPTHHRTEAMPQGRPHAPTIPGRVFAGMRVADLRLRRSGPPGGYLPFVGSLKEGVEFTVHEPGPLRPVYLCVAWQEATKLVLAYGCGITDGSARDAALFHLDRKCSVEMQAVGRPGLGTVDGALRPPSRSGITHLRDTTRLPNEDLTHA